MRALCGAIITAGALIGLGLTAVGIGIRYQYYAEREEVGGAFKWVLFKQLDTPLMVIIVALIIMAVVGLAIAILGLALHHERRVWEREHFPGSRPETPTLAQP